VWYGGGGAPPQAAPPVAVGLVALYPVASVKLKLSSVVDPVFVMVRLREPSLLRVSTPDA
jgi:hypothetical protein